MYHFTGLTLGCLPLISWDPIIILQMTSPSQVDTLPPHSKIHINKWYLESCQLWGSSAEIREHRSVFPGPPPEPLGWAVHTGRFRGDEEGTSNHCASLFDMSRDTVWNEGLGEAKVTQENLRTELGTLQSRFRARVWQTVVYVLINQQEKVAGGLSILQ